jgi:hypothetical protein
MKSMVFEGFQPVTQAVTTRDKERKKMNHTEAQRRRKTGEILTANDANRRESVREEIFAPGRPLGFGTFLPPPALKQVC